MEFFEVLKKRHSIRVFQKREIEKEKILEIMNAINSAPSAGNLQSYKVFIVRDEKKKEKLVEASFGQEFIAQAPVVFVFCALQKENKYGERGKRLYSLQDATIAAAYSQLAATALGLGSVWVGAFDENKVLEILGNPKDLLPIAIIPIGYKGEEPKGRKRKKLEEIFQEV
ncbi:MAG: nitroreductase family protein [Candidatus Micrarchaeales archaeon]